MLLYLQQPRPTNYTSHYLSTGLTPHYNLIFRRERARHGQHRHTAWDKTCLSQPPCTRELQCRNPTNAWEDGAVGHILRCRLHGVTRKVPLTAAAPHLPPRPPHHRGAAGKRAGHLPWRPARPWPPENLPRRREIPSPSPHVPKERGHRCQTSPRGPGTPPALLPLRLPPPPVPQPRPGLAPHSLPPRVSAPCRRRAGSTPPPLALPGPAERPPPPDTSVRAAAAAQPTPSAVAPAVTPPAPLPTAHHHAHARGSGSSRLLPAPGPRRRSAPTPAPRRCPGSAAGRPPA